MFNEDQRAYMKYLSEQPPETKCWCGWYLLGKCPHCPAGKTVADKLKVQCPDCHNDPGPNCDRPIIHRFNCPQRAAPEAPK